MNTSSPPSSPPFPWPAVFLWALAPAILLLAWHAPQPLVRSARAIAFSWQLDGEEGFLLDQALQLSRGRSIYPSIATEPYLVGNYPPVYPAIWAAMELITGRNGSLALGRLICLLAFTAIIVLVFLMAWRGTSRLALAPLAPLLFTVTYDWFDWIAYARVDIPAMAFATASLAVIIFSPPEKLPRRALWAAGLSLLALYTKQTMLAAPLAIAVWLAWRDRRALVWFIIALAGAGALLFILLALITDGEFYRHLVLYNANKFAWFQVTAGMKHLWFFQKWVLMAMAVGAAGAAFVMWVDWRDHRDSMHSGDAAPRHMPSLLPICALYAFFSVANLWAIGKEGSATNYLLEVHLSLALLIPALISALLRPLEHDDGAKQAIMSRLTLVGITALLTIHAGVLLLPVAPNAHLTKAAILFSRPTPTRADAERERVIEAEVTKTLALAGAGSVLAEYPIYGLHRGERPVIQPFIMSQLAREDKWDPEPLLADIRAGRFRWLLTTQDLERDQSFYRWSPEFLAVFRLNFVLRTKFTRLEEREQMFLYEYRPHSQ